MRKLWLNLLAYLPKVTVLLGSGTWKPGLYWCDDLHLLSSLSRAFQCRNVVVPALETSLHVH